MNDMTTALQHRQSAYLTFLPQGDSDIISLFISMWAVSAMMRGKQWDTDIAFKSCMYTAVLWTVQTQN